MGRDADVAARMLQEAGIDAAIIPSVDHLVDALDEGAGFAIVTEEALMRANLRGVVQFLEAQEDWSDFPFILLTQRGGGLERNPAAKRFLDALGNVTFLERPFHPTTLISLSQSALRARRRQYDARQRMMSLNEAQEKLQVALDAGHLGAWSVDVADRRLSTSPSCRELYGQDPAREFSLDALMATIVADDHDQMLAAVQHSLESGSDYYVEYRIELPNGAERWIQAHGRPSYDQGGTPTRITGVAQDVTDRKLWEASMHESKAELEARVLERTKAHEVAVAQLHEAQKIETLGQLTGGVAHDFNNLLTPIVGGLDILRRLHEDERSQKIVGGAIQAADRATTLVARLLAFARRQSLEARPINTAALLLGVIDLIRQSLGPQIDIEVEAPTDLPPAQVDPNQLELALLNLAVNARDAMPEGGKLSLGVALTTLHGHNEQLRAGDYISISVTDTGHGMDQETVRRAVEPFYSTKGVGKGTGLGLSMVHGLAAQSGGIMRLVSTPGIGTKVEILLPIAPSLEEDRTAMALEDDLPATSGKLDVLLVDDEPLVRSATAEMLIGLGHSVAEAGSADEAYRILRTRSFDLLISDYLMPRVNGLQLIEHVTKCYPALPSLLITGYANLAPTEGQGVTRLAKPFRQSQLANALARLTGKRLRQEPNDR